MKRNNLSESHEPVDAEVFTIKFRHDENMSRWAVDWLYAARIIY